MISLRIIFIYLLLIPMASYAVEKCTPSDTKCTNTALGKVVFIASRKSADGYSRITLDGQEIYKDKTDYITPEPRGWVPDKENKIDKMIVTYEYDKPKIISKNHHQYRAYVLLDFSGKKVIISNEFYPPADYDAKLEWISWGKKNSVIAFEDGSHFKYENGHVTMIDDGSSETGN